MHPLLFPLLKLAKRAIFDSEAADDLLAFAQKLLAIHAEMGIDIADLNWARTEMWRDLLASTFDSQERVAHLRLLSSAKLTYNAHATEFFCHLKIQAIYLFAWLRSRLQREIQGSFEMGKWENLGPGTITATELATQDEFSFKAHRTAEEPHRVTIELASREKCELPYSFVLGQTASGQSLVKEITTKGTSLHFVDALQELSRLKRLC